MKGGLLTETYEKGGDVHHVRGVASGVVIHLVLFPGLVLYDIQENVDGRVGVLGGRAIPVASAMEGRTSGCAGWS